MITTYIKYTFMLLCCFYIFSKILYLKQTRLTKFAYITFTLLITFVLSYINEYHITFFLPLMIITFIVSTTLINKIPATISVTASMLSLGLSYFLFLVSSTLTILVDLLLYILSIDFPEYYTLSVIITGIIQLCLSIALFQIRRLKNGMPFILQKTPMEIGVIMSGLILLLTYVYSVRQQIEPLLIYVLIFIILAGLFIITWWHMQLTNSYILKTKQRELSLLYEELDKLQSDNNKLSKLIHKDNKLIPAMTSSMNELLNTCTKCNTIDQLHAVTEKGCHILKELEILTKERGGILTGYENTTKTFPPTGVTRIDSLISYMHQKALSLNTCFDFINNVSLSYVTENIINTDTLFTLVADIVENAIISAKEQPVSNVLLCLTTTDTHFCIDVYDSGKAFDKNVLKNFGLTRYTTHKNEGGSGIGLMTTYEIMTKTNASFCLEELDNNNSYTKKVSICFDELKELRVNIIK